MRVLLILVDGMRPESLYNIRQAQEMKKKASYTMNAKTVIPPVTLPCHMSLFHSVPPERHGTTTNVYMPQVRPVRGLFEVIVEKDKKSAFFYSWGELRDISKPASTSFTYFIKGRDIGYDKANDILTDEAISYIKNNYVDFTFLYLAEVDEVGHKYGWMSEEYMDAMQKSWDNIERIISTLPEDYTVIVTADHGGHDRVHGMDIPEDMTIPMFFMGKDFESGKELKNVSIMDLAPTIANILKVDVDIDWEGKSLV